MAHTCGLHQNKGIAGLANSGVIPGKVNPKIADDTTIMTKAGPINAKRGEYVLSDVDVALLGGPKAVDAMVKALREKHGLPTKTGPKTHSQRDAFGRKDKPGLTRGIAGFADGGFDDMVTRVANSPLVKGAKLYGRAVGASLALPAAAVHDVGAKILNTGNILLGGDRDVFDTGDTQRVINYATGSTTDPKSGPTAYGPQPTTIPDADYVRGALPPRDGSISSAYPATRPPEPISTNIATQPPTQAPQLAQQPAAVSPRPRLPITRPTASPKPTGPDYTVDQVLGQISANQAAGRETGKLPQGVSGYMQVVGDDNDVSFKPSAQRGALFTDAGYYTGSDFGNSPMANGGGKTRISEIAKASNLVNQQRSMVGVQQATAAANNPFQPIAVGPIESYLSRVDPTLKKLAPGRALGIARSMRDSDLMAAQRQQELSTKDKLGIAELQMKQRDLDLHAPLWGAEADYHRSQANLNNFQTTPEYYQRQERTDQRKERKERISGLVKDWSGLNLPPEHIANLNKYASIVAESEDPRGKVFMIPAYSQDRSNMAVPREYESIYKAWLAKGYGTKVAAERTLNEVKTAGHPMEPIPHFNWYQPLKLAQKNTLGLE